MQESSILSAALSAFDASCIAFEAQPRIFARRFDGIKREGERLKIEQQRANERMKRWLELRDEFKREMEELREELVGSVTKTGDRLLLVDEDGRAVGE